MGGPDRREGGCNKQLDNHVSPNHPTLSLFLSVVGTDREESGSLRQAVIHLLLTTVTLLSFLLPLSHSWSIEDKSRDITLHSGNRALVQQSLQSQTTLDKFCSLYSVFQPMYER